MVDVLGATLGRYELRERLGRGGMAAVYKGWDMNLDRWVAVKVLHDHLVDEADFKERFEHEAKLVASLNYPNIVQVYDFDSTQLNDVPVYYMVMAYISGPSLKSLMDDLHSRGVMLSTAQIANVMRGVLSALSYAHKQGMIHRDVTPGNILFNENNQPILTDFGIARLISGARLTQSGMTAGTPMYMPPEQGMGVGGDHRSDIYSMGVILYEMLVGKAPYSADTAVAVILKHINEPVPSPREMNNAISPSLENVVLRAMAKDPADRYQDAAAFLDDYEEALGGGHITALQGPRKTILLPGSASPRSASKIPWGIIAAAVAVIVLVLVVAVISRPVGTQAGQPADSVTLAAMPNLNPTNDVSSMTSGPLFFTDAFDPIRGDFIWDTTSENGVSRKIENGVFHIQLTRPATALDTTFDPDHQYADQTKYEGDFTISTQSQPDSGAGIIFRYQDGDNYYVYGVNGQGAVSLWLRSNGKWTELRKLPVNWTPVEGAKPAGQPNHLMLLDEGKHLQAYINGNLVIDVQSEPVISSGAIGIYVATTSSLKIPNPLADVSIDNFSAAFIEPAGGTAAAAIDAATAAVTEVGS